MATTVKHEAMPVRQREVYVHDCRLIRPGDQVRLIPASQRAQDRNAQQHFTHLRDWLGGTGPFTVSWIGRWPCGKNMLYLKGTKAGEPGASASDFM